MKLIASALAVAGASAATLKTVPGGEVIDGDYIVVMKKTASIDTLEKTASKCFNKGTWKNLHDFKGFAARLSEDELNTLLADENVDFIEPDTVMKIDGSFRNQTATANMACSNTQTQTSSWGQSRTTRTSGYSTSSFDHESSWGQGIRVYVIDTGTKCTHTDFDNCECGPAYGTGADGCADGNGHGTHCSSTAGGQQWGVAKSATMVGVKVLGDSGSGSTSNVISGMNWVAGVGSGGVASMSLGGGYSSASNNAVDGMTAAGVFVSVAAGNCGRDACNYSPASAPTAYTVGATTTSDSRSSFSNTGTCVDIFAPGSSITAAWYTSNTATAVLSGTSMACPHVAGAAAAIRSENPSYSVSQVKSALDNLALSGVVSGPGTGSPNKLLHLDC